MQKTACLAFLVLLFVVTGRAAAGDLPVSIDNPVYQETLADPFCLFHDGTYYVVGTADVASHDRKVPMIKSKDLQHWEDVGPVLVPPADEAKSAFWAPELAFENGTFFLFYSANGNGRHGGLQFRIRVATSKSAEGPYVDTDQPLTSLEATNHFAIDPDVFVDEDGERYLFYATDFYDFDSTTFRGTALEMCHLKSMTEVDGKPTVVMRAHWPWQIYQRNRNMGGKVIGPGHCGLLKAADGLDYIFIMCGIRR